MSKKTENSLALDLALEVPWGSEHEGTSEGGGESSEGHWYKLSRSPLGRVPGMSDG